MPNGPQEAREHKLRRRRRSDDDGTTMSTRTEKTEQYKSRLACSRLRNSRVHWIEKARTRKWVLRAFSPLPDHESLEQARFRICKTKTLHARASRFLVNIHFFTVTACAATTWKCLISYFQCGGREHNIWLFSFPEFRNSLLEWTSAKIANIWQIERVGITAIKFEAVGLLFLKWPFRTGSPLLLLRIWARTRAETLVTQAYAKPSRLYP